MSISNLAPSVLIQFHLAWHYYWMNMKKYVCKICSPVDYKLGIGMTCQMPHNKHHVRNPEQ